MTPSKSWEKLISIVNQGTISTRNRYGESLKGSWRTRPETSFSSPVSRRGVENFYWVTNINLDLLFRKAFEWKSRSRSESTKKFRACMAYEFNWGYSTSKSNTGLLTKGCVTLFLCCHLCLLALCVVWGWGVGHCAVHLDGSVAPVVPGVLVTIIMMTMAVIIGHNGRCHTVLRVVAPRNS